MDDALSDMLAALGLTCPSCGEAKLTARDGSFGTTTITAIVRCPCGLEGEAYFNLELEGVFYQFSAPTGDELLH